MRVILHVTMPLEPFNSYVRDGSAGKRVQKILEEIKPETVYFTETDGHRGAFIVVDLADASKIPSLVEPFFLTLNATVRIHPAMTPEDLGKSGIDAIGKKW